MSRVTVKPGWLRDMLDRCSAEVASWPPGLRNKQEIAVAETVCPFCGAYSVRSCELLDETEGVCPWEESQPDPDLLLENHRERKRLEKEHPFDE